MSCTVLSPRGAMVNKADNLFIVMEYTFYWEETDHKEMNKTKIKTKQKNTK